MGNFRKKCGAAIVLLHCIGSSIAYSVRNAEYPTLRAAVVPVNSEDPAKEELILQRPPNSQIIVGEGEEISLNSRITLECEASYPVQFVYTGDGVIYYKMISTALRHK